MIILKFSSDIAVELVKTIIPDGGAKSSEERAEI
jgi:hypothetical protein